MFKNALIFGLLGFAISLGTIYVAIPEKESASEGFSSLSYEDGINGWISFGNILKENICGRQWNQYVYQTAQK
jgi:hypothetical protein